MRFFHVLVLSLVFGALPHASAQLTTNGNEIWNQGSNGVPGNFENNDRFGDALAAGDFNADGWDDLAIGSWRESGDKGIVHVIYGGASGLSSLGVQEWAQGAGGLEGNDEDGDAFGFDLAVGDFNGDSFKDLAIGAPGEDSVRGAVYVLFGSSAGLSSVNHQVWTGDSSDVPGNGERNDQFGRSLAAGDFNGDGNDELAIGVPFEQNGEGELIVLIGNVGGLVTTGAQRIRQGSDGIQGDREPGDFFSWALTTGDFNGDGLADLIASTPGENGERGRIYMIPGSGGGLDPGASRRWQQGGDGLPGDNESNDFFGDVVAAGDFDGDGFDDVAVTAIGENSGRGDVTIIRGSTGGLTATGAQQLRQGNNGFPDDDESGDRFGSGLAAGDFNQDGFMDLAIGVRGEDDNAGLVHVLYGAGGGLTLTGIQPLAQGTGGLLDDRENRDDFGNELAAGNFGRDGASDLAIAAPGEDGDSGIVHVVYGESSQGLAPPAISRVVGAANSQPFVEQVAQNGLITFYGSNFGPPEFAREVGASDLVNGLLPTRLGDICIEADGSLIPLLYVSTNQINAQADNIPLFGSVRFQVFTQCGEFGEQASNAYDMPVASSAPESFYLPVQSTAGRRLVVAQNASRGLILVAERGLIPGAITEPARPGDVVTVFMTGLGETTPRILAGELPPPQEYPVVLPVRGTLGGFELFFSYVGATPGFAGLYQASFTVPAGLAPGEYELLIELGGIGDANATPPGGHLVVGP